MTLRTPSFLAAPLLLLGLIGCDTRGSPGGMTGQGPPLRVAPDAGNAAAPTVRLYLLTDLAGAIEPCGCIKDQLGGMDHFGAWVYRERAHGPAALVAAAGPLFFMDDELPGDRAFQDRQKATTIASLLRGLRLAAFAPGINDWDDGESGLVALARASGAAIIAGSAAAGPPPMATAIVKEVGGIKVGFVGFGQGPPTPAASDAGAEDPKDVVERGVDLAKRQGANVLVALTAVGRDEARRIAEAVPELTAIVVGTPKATGEENTRAPQGEQAGGVLVVQGGNHLQSVAVLDLYVRDHVSPGELIKFADATGLERAQEREAFVKRTDDLHEKITIWERGRTLPKADIEARRRELVGLEEERQRLDAKPPPAQGSFFRYSLKEVRPSLGNEQSIQAEVGAYFQGVNGQNQIALAGRMPLPAVAGHARYVGGNACVRCHAPAVAMWRQTWHANAYETLRAEGREFDLECVGCHVTGYRRAAGSTVTHLDKLQNVQCEACHGPGSWHVANPTDEKAIIAKPEAGECLGCHRSPHVEQFDPVAAMKDILGPGHGMPLKKERP